MTATMLLVLQLALSFDGLAVEDHNADDVERLIALELVEEVAEDLIYPTPEGERVARESAR